MSHPYPQFRAALEALATTDERRAQRLGVTRVTVNGWLSGKVRPRLEMLNGPPIRAAEHLRASQDEIHQARHILIAALAADLADQVGQRLCAA